MNINENVKNFIKNLDDLEANILKAQDYIKENLNVDSEFNANTGKLHIWCENAENALYVARAKEYIQETIGEDLVQVIYGK